MIRRQLTIAVLCLSLSSGVPGNATAAELAPRQPVQAGPADQTTPPDQAAASERDRVVATVQALFDAMAAKDAAAIDALLLPEGAVAAARVTGDRTEVEADSQGGFGERIVAFPGQLLERFWDPTVLIHGPIAVVWTPYDFHVDGELSHCGVDAFTLVRADGAWRISGITYTAEREGCSPSPLGPVR